MKYLTITALFLFFLSCTTSKGELTRSSVEEKMGIAKSSFEDEKEAVAEKSDEKEYEEVYSAEHEGDKAINLLDKYILYKEAFEIAAKRNYPDIERIENKLIEVKDNLDISIEVISNIDNSLSSIVRKNVTNKGYKVNDIGYLTLLIEIATKDVTLENEYYNKYWNLSISLVDAKGNIVESKSFSGRESQITEDFLDSIILQEVEKRMNKYVKDLLP